ncbi:MAG: hypothetical protein Q8M09_06150 [Pseudomonadota bacterium]|nr:hypothetical protein [Pseudomonadota bacterium]MDP1903811.1 hypothetical protein [Pseudomonadota bacterium]MDP2353752.1 hypothetical protein [Pseudomonadota bacterium]
MAWLNLSSDVPETTAPAARARSGGLPPLLPYFCDQQPVERGFNQSMLAWSGSAMLLPLKR